MKIPPMEVIRTSTAPMLSEMAENLRLHDFYGCIWEKGGEFKEISIRKVKFVARLMAMGFRRYDLTVSESKYVRIRANTIEEVSEKTITDEFLKWVQSLPEYTHTRGDHSKRITADIIVDKLYMSLETYFKPALFNRMIHPDPIEIKQDTATEKYLFYQNCWITITAQGYQRHTYAELTGYVWKDSILPRDFSEPENRLSYFEIFCKNISGNKTGTEPERFQALKTIIGYNLHAFYKGKLKATILTDSRISEDGEANGRTGKGIICKALGNMLNADPKKSTVYVRINGRDYNPRNINKHADCNLDTRLLHIEDIYNNYNIEHSFNDITDGLTVRKLFQSAFSIQVKIIFSTNKTIIIDGESAKDRVIQYELADYYNADFDPSQEFQHWFFDDWKPEEWARFDLFMMDCICVYMQRGIIEPPAINLRMRTLTDHTSKEFKDFMDDLFNGQTITYRLTDLGTTTTHDFKIVPGTPVLKRELYEAFRQNNPDFNNLHFKQKTFTGWVRLYANAVGIKKEEGRSNGRDTITFNINS